MKSFEIIFPAVLTLVFTVASGAKIEPCQFPLLISTVPVNVVSSTFTKFQRVEFLKVVEPLPPEI